MSDDSPTFTLASLTASVPMTWKEEGLSAAKRIIADAELFELVQKASMLTTQAAEIMEAVGLVLGIDPKSDGPKAPFILGMLVGVASLDEAGIAKVAALERPPT